MTLISQAPPPRTHFRNLLCSTSTSRDHADRLLRGACDPMLRRPIVGGPPPPLQDLRELPRFVTQSVRNGVFSSPSSFSAGGAGGAGTEGEGKGKGKAAGRPTKLAAT